MKKTIIQFSILAYILISCTPQSDKNLKKFTLKGEINGQDTGNIVLIYWPDTIPIYDTVKIQNSKFEFTGRIFEPLMADLDGGNDLNRLLLYLEPKKMKITLIKDRFSEYKMTGSKTQTDYDSLNNIIKSFHDKISEFREQLASVNDSLKNIMNDSIKLLLDNKSLDIERQWTLTSKQIDSVRIKFVIENPKSFLTLFYLNMISSNDVISLDSTKLIFNKLEESLKESRYAKYILEDIRKKENVSLGALAPDFKATSLDDQIITLSQFKGESVVLLDFWASWCVPCRKSFPHLKTIYDKYHSKGLELIAISTDYNRNNWIEAVKNDSLDNWYHILIADKWPAGPITNDDIFQNYYNTAIPEQILIDKNGKIIYRHVGYSKESEESLDRLLSELFSD